MPSSTSSDPAAPVAGRSSSARAGASLLWVGLAGVALLVVACAVMAERRFPAWTAFVFAAGLLAWAAVAFRSAGLPEQLGPVEDSRVSRPRLAVGLTAAFLLAAVAWMQTRGGEFGRLGTAAWLAAIAAWFAAWWPAGRRAPDAADTAPSRRLAAALALVALIGVAGVFRFHRLAEIPPHPGSDHAEDLMNLVDLEAGQRPVFFPRNTGQPPLPFYWEHFLHRVVGLPLNFMTLKVGTALIGLLAVPAMYLLAREMGGASMGLVAAALLAWSKWPTLGARRGLTFAWAVFPAALAMWALLRYMRRGDRASALAAGFWLGLGQFGYNAFKIVPAMVPVLFGLALFDRRWRGRRGRLFSDGLLVTATALLVFLPLLQYMLERPQDFWYRAMTRAGSQERPLPGPAAELFAANLRNMALAFHWKGDGAWINTPSHEPFLDPVTGALLLAGVLVAGARAVRGSPRWAAILVSLFVLTLASTLALAFPIENPGINRAAVAMPSVFVLAALPAAWMISEARGRSAGTRVLLAVVLGALAAFSVRENYRSYFVRFRQEQTAILEPAMDLVRLMQEYRDTRGVPFDNVYLLNTGNWIDGRSIGFEIRDLRWQDPHDIAPGRPVPVIHDRPLLFLYHPSDAERRAQLRARFPEGEELLVSQPHPDRNYFAYYVPRGSEADPAAPRPPRPLQ